MSLQVFCFSPRGTTRRTAQVAADAVGGPQKWYDLGRRSFPVGMRVSPADTCIIAVPCFSGRVPPVIADRIASLRGSGAKALVIATFGNRAYEDSLLELCDLAEAAGFHVTGAAAVAAQHSLAPLIGSGRPDARDLKEVVDFARQAAAYEGTAHAEPPGHRPYRPYNRLGYAPGPTQTCVQCRRCAEVCPVDAIQKRRGVPADISKCLGCMTCVESCPHQCRQLPEQVSREIGARLAASATGRAQSEFYLAR